MSRGRTFEYSRKLLSFRSTKAEKRLGILTFYPVTAQFLRLVQGRVGTLDNLYPIVPFPESRYPRADGYGFCRDKIGVGNLAANFFRQQVRAILVRILADYQKFLAAPTTRDIGFFVSYDGKYPKPEGELRLLPNGPTYR